VTEDVFIGLVSNLGDRELNLLRAVAEIGKIPDTRITALSSVYETAAVGEVEQPDFINAAAKLQTSLPPRRLLSEFQRIETELFHRVRTIRWGPRRIDIDILFYGNVIMEDEDLTIPHPRLHERRFVLQPLADVASDFLHPLLNRSVTELLAALGEDQRVTKV